MPTTRLMTTVLPYSVDPDARFHVSLFLSHRLDGGGKLSSYPAMVNWVKTLTHADTTIVLRTDNAANPISCTPLLDVAGETAWSTTFPPSTDVRSYPKPVVTDAEWRSFPAHRMPDHALAAHYASMLCSPVNRPSVLHSPLADAVLSALDDVDGAAAVIRDLRAYRDGLQRHRDELVGRRNAAANQALAPVKPDPEDPDPVNPPHRAREAAGQPWRSPIELLLSHETLDDDITKHLDALLDAGQAIEAGVPPGPTSLVLRDLHGAYRYYERKEAQYEPAPLPTQQLGPARTPHPPPDFHERVAAVCNVPALARKLGLVVDVKVDPAALDVLRTATRIWCDVTVAGTEKYLSPETLCKTEGSRFYALPEDGTRWGSGRMRIGNPDRYRVMDLDPDAAGLALEQHLRSTIRAFAIAVNGDRGSYAPAGLRASGFAVAELERSARLRTQVEAGEAREPVVETPGAPQQRQTFHFEGLLRGTRVEVWDDVTRRWHSLHDRRVTASFRESDVEKPIITNVVDPGMLQNPPLSRTPGAATNPYYVHEVLAGWDGRSLSAPSPGLNVIHNATDQPDPEAERIDAQAEAIDGLRVQSTIEPKSLPALRFGRKYAFRIAGVDLAGNFVPMDQEPPAAVPEPLIGAAADHLDRLRAEATGRESVGLLQSLRASGGLPCREASGDGTRADVERATASVVVKASSLTMHPQWDVDPELLATLAADAADPETVTAPRKFLRWDPITAPALVPRSAYTTGESLQRMVIRTGLVGTPGLCQRHVVPPKGSELEAEQDGRFDELMRTGNRVRAYAIALKERGNLFHTRIQDLNDPKGTVAQPGVALLAMPGATGLQTLENVQDPKYQPAEGQYVVHDVDQMVVPYLPDPFARGVALVFYEAGADHQFTNPKVLQSVFVPYQGAWPELQPLRLVLHSAPRLDARQDGNVINVGLPPGDQVAVRLSTTLDDEHLQKLGLWVHHPGNDPNVPEDDRDVLADAARNGWMWWLTPDEDLRLVHATARPAIAPKIARLAARPRNRGVVPVLLDGVLDVHGASTDKVELRATWTDCIDDPASEGPTERTTAEVVVDYRIADGERFSLLTLDPPNMSPAKDVGTRTVTEPIRTALHGLPDTRARTVKYQLRGSSRYREFFAPNELPGLDDPGSAGNVVEVNVPSSASPAPPVIHDVIPMFLWEQTTEPEQPFAVRRIRRSGVRIWLDRPWWSSGCGETLAVITTGDPNLPGVRPETVSLWARDPILQGPAMSFSYEVPVLPAWQQRAVQLRLAPESLPGRPVRHVVRRGPNDANERDKVVNAYAYVPEFDGERKRWFVDVVLDSARAVWPFLRLAVARYQPNSIVGQEFSEVVATDFVQLPPERIGTLSRPDAEHVRISLSGVTAVTSAPGVQLPGSLVDALPKARRVVATLQARKPGSGSDLDWVPIHETQCELAGVDPTTFTATWSAALPLTPPQPLRTPASVNDLRVQVEEYEVLSADSRPGESALSAARRLVFADHFYL